MSGVETGMVTWSSAIPTSPAELEQAGFDEPSVNPELLKTLAASARTLQLVRYPEGYIAAGFATADGALPEMTAPPILAAAPGREVTLPRSQDTAAKYHASIGWRTPRITGLVTEVRTVNQHDFGLPYGRTVINPYIHSFELYAHEILTGHDQLPDGTEVSLTLTEQASVGTRSFLRIHMPNTENPEAKGLRLDLMSPIDPQSPGDEARFTRIDVLGPKGIGELLLAQDLPIQDIAVDQASIDSKEGVQTTLTTLSALLGVELTRPLDRRETARKVLETMSNGDFSVLRALVFAKDVTAPATEVPAPKRRKLKSLLGH